MTIDWNWFFAGFAQCAAALIAIIGAFIISKLLGENEKEERTSSNVDDLVIRHSDLKKRISIRLFSWWDERTIEYSSVIGDSIESGEFNGLDDNKLLEKLFEVRPDLFKTPNCLAVLKERISSEAPVSKSVGDGLSFIQKPMQIPKITPVGLWDDLNREKERIYQLQIESETLIEQFRKVQTDIDASQNNLTPIRRTIQVLIVGLILTVVYPLHFIPIGLNETPTLSFSIDIICQNLFSIKGLLLVLLTLIIGGLFTYFLYLIRQIDKSYGNSRLRLEDRYFDISSYSIYF